jgi:hypothetical protein
MLPDERRKQLDGIVQQMVANNEPDENIRIVVDDFKAKYTKQGAGGLAGAALGFGKQTISTLQNVGNVIAKPVDKLFDKVIGDDGRTPGINPERLTLDSTAEKVGGFASDVATMAVPGAGITKVGKAAQVAVKGASAASKALGVGARAATEGVGFTAAEAAKQGELNASAVGAGSLAAALPVVGSVVKGAAGLAGRTTKNVAAAISGKGTKVIDAVIDNPQAALKGLRGEASLQGSAAALRTRVSELAKAASDEFGEDLANLPKRLGRPSSTPGGKTTIKQGGENVTLSLQGVKAKLTTVLRAFDVGVDPRAKHFDFSEAPLDGGESARLKEVFGTINQWSDTSPVGFHKLARKISNFRKPGEQSRELNAIIDSVSRNVRNYIGERMPEAKQMLAKYAHAQDLIEAFDQEFATDGRTVGGLADRIKTERKIGSIFSGEKESTLNLLETNVPGGRDIVAQEAGRELAEGLTRASSSIGDFLRSAIQTVVSPKTVGTLAAYTGLAAPKAEQMLRRLQTLDPAARATAIQTIATLFDEENPVAQ